MKLSSVLSVTGIVATLSVAASLLGAAPAGAQPSPAPTTGDTGFSAAPAGVPVVDSQMKVGAQLTAEPTRVDVVRDDSSPSSALVRITALEPAAASDLFAQGALALRVDARAAASTTVLVPLDAEGAFMLSASTPVDARVEPVAYFDAHAAPGSVAALPEAVVRTDPDGSALSPSGAVVGLTGLGGVPSTGVRSVFVTATFSVAEKKSATVELDGVEIPVTNGTSVSTFVSPSADGDMVISGAANVTVDVAVRGWVVEASQTDRSSLANLTGSIVPLTKSSTRSSTLDDKTATPITSSALASDNSALVLVWADAAPLVTTIAPSERRSGRASGAVVDGKRGAAPQLLLLDPDHHALATSRGEVDAHTRIVAGVIGAQMPKASELRVSVSGPADGAKVDLADSGGTVDLAGTITARGGDLASVEVSEGDTVLGSPELRYVGGGVSWVFRTAAPRSGTYTFTITATDRSGARAEARVRVDVSVPGRDKTIIVDNVQILDDKSAGAVTALTEDTVELLCQLDVGPGDFIVASSIPGAPDGFLRRIRAVDMIDGAALLHTEPAVITDVVVQAHVEDERTLGEEGGIVVEEAAPDPAMTTLEGDLPTAWVSSGDLASADFPALGEPQGDDASAKKSRRAQPFGVELSTSSEATATAKFGLALSSKLGSTVDASKTDGAATKKKQKAEGGFYVETTASASAKLSIAIDVKVEWSWGIPTATADFENAFTLSAKLESKVAAYLKASGSVQKNGFSKDVAKYYFPGFTIYLGIPVWVSPEMSLDLNGSIEASASVEYTLEQSVTKKIGVKCVDGVCTKIDSTPKGADGSRDLKAVKDTFTGGGSLSASIGPEFSAAAMLYGAAGPEVSLSLALGGEAEIEGSSDGPTLSGSIELFVEAGAGVSLVIKIPVIDKKILEWEAAKVSAKFTLAKWEFERNLSKEDDEPGSGASGSSGTKPVPGEGGGGRRDAIDVVFVIDTTGSMGGIIGATLEKARDIATRLSTSARSARVGLVEYRDYGDNIMARTVSPLSNDLLGFSAALDSLWASGGGDWEEAVYSGIVTALAEDWRPEAARTIIVMGDAPAHDPEVHTEYTSGQVADFLTGRQALCRNGEGNIIGGPELPTCVTGERRTARSSATQAGARASESGAPLPVILFGISSDGLLSSQLAPLAEATGGTVAGIDGAGAVGDAIDEALATAGAAPQPYFEWMPGEQPGEIRIDASGSRYEGDSARLAIDFGDGSDPSVGGAIATHRYGAPGEYTVTLTVTDSQGRVAQATAKLSVAAAPPQWNDLPVSVDRRAVQAGDEVTFTVAGLAPGTRVSVEWNGISGATVVTTGDDGNAAIVRRVPVDAKPGDLQYTVRALDERLIGTGKVTITAPAATCRAR